MKDKFNRGFTLIELLVVIAIIGILSSVVLASLNTARGKGSDAAIKASLANARAQAELYYDGHSNSYQNVCTDTAGILNMKNGATNAGSAAVVCNDTGGANTAWAMSAQLKSDTTKFWCVDSTGTSTEKAAGVGAATSC